ncbi:ABC transporter substrate-binding protein [Nisaea acidiphila]|uniref:ABC transporter substrate-binding protein n=1 Tax=Nisaea acidiphila TaxID=1862145 RepID=A0A9J7AWD7_9PROT|nr:ABC transporter substrate-binding protein [Nisaea acidiphila]UUX51114.1 ABC transporter substrate-binding protein [Nisaea acidiphila]
MKRFLAASALASLALVSAVPAALAGKADDTLNIVWERELENVDSYFNTAREGIIFSRMTWDALLYRNPQTMAYEPLIAKSYKWVDDTTLEFELNEGITFHNGEELDADDVVFTYNWVSNPDNGVKTQRNVNWIKGAKKLDKYKLQVMLKAPFPAALEFVAGSVSIYPKDYYEKVGPDGMGLKPVGSGPYKVTELEPGKKIVWEKFDGYMKGSPKGTPTIGKVIQRTIPERNTQIAELLAGRADWMWRVPADQADRLSGSGRVQVVNEQTFRIGYITMDAAGATGDTPLKNPLVRKAIAHAIDREAIVKALVRGKSSVVHSACFPTQFGCEQGVTKYPYDPAKAKELLAEAGYPNGFEIPFYAYRNRDYAEAMIGFLNQVGIKTNFGYLKYAALRDKIRAKEVPMAFMTWGSYSVNDVSAITSNFFTHGKDDLALDPQVKELLHTGDTTVDSAARKTAYSAALKRIADEAYWIPLWSYNTNYAFSNDVDFTPTSDEIPRFFTAKWK